MKVLLFGKDGQVGQALQPVLARLGELVALGRAEADFEQPGELPRLIATHAPDIIVNAAAYTAVDKAESEPERARLINAEAVAALAAAAQRSGAWLIHYSTDFVFDGSKQGAYVETDAPNPLSVYGTTKLKGDLAIAASGCKHLIFRVSWVYGAGNGNFPAAMLRLGKERTTLNVVADQVGAPTSADTIAAVTASTIAYLGVGGADELSGLYHLAAAGAVSRQEMAQFVIAEALARGAQLALTPDAILPILTAAYPSPAVRPLNSRLDTGKLRTTFGVALPPWQDDLRHWVAARVARGEA